MDEVGGSVVVLLLRKAFRDVKILTFAVARHRKTSA